MIRTPRPIRVCYLIDRLMKGGTELHLLRLINNFDRTKVQPYLFLLNEKDPESSTLEPSSCPVHSLNIKSLLHPSTLGKAVNFIKFLRSEKIDILDLYFPDSTYFGAITGRLAGVKIIRNRRNLGYWMTRAHCFMGHFCNLLVDVTVANCNASRESIIQQEGPSPDRVVVLENGIDLNPFLAIPSIDIKRSDHCPKVVGIVTHLRHIKGPDVFVRAARIIVRSHPFTHFKIVGSGDDVSLLSLANECGLNGNIELKGTLLDIPSFLSHLDIAVLSSRSEGLSNALLEYMAAGRPIVATAVGGNVELIEDGVNGLLVPADDPQSLAEAILTLLNDPVLAGQLGTQAKRDVERRFGLQAELSQYQKLYSQITNNKAID